MTGEQELRYALAKQVPTIRTVLTDYGELPLTQEMIAEISKVVKQHLLRALTHPNEAFAGKGEHPFDSDCVFQECVQEETCRAAGYCQRRNYRSG